VVSDEVEIVPDPDCVIQSGIFIPNVFSPNGDNRNDVFSIDVGPDVTRLTINGTIYDRWGNVVFASGDNPFVWDGRFGDDEVMPGVYVYRIVCKYEINGDRMEETFHGDVTLVR
jgi:gliding motility-associated-like protein